MLNPDQKRDVRGRFAGGSTVIYEDDDRFVVKRADGSTFRVAKARLAHGTVEKIRKYAMGGEVKGYQEGGEVFGSQPLPAPAPSFMSMTTGVPDVPVPPQPMPVEQGLTPAAMLPPDAAAQLAALKRPTPMDATAGILAMPAPPLPAVQPAPAPPQQPQGFKTATAPTAFDRALQESIRGAQQMATAKSAEAQKFEQLRGEANVREAETKAAFEKRINAHEVGRRALFEDVAAEKIDPEKFWASRTTGQKIASTIGLILGGLGAGLAKGPNYALDMFNRAIDRDLEAQRINLAHKKTMLGEYVQQGYDMRTAYALAKGDAQEILAGQLAAAASKFADPKAQAEAMTLIGAARAQAAATHQAAEQNALALQMSKMQIEWQHQITKVLQGQVAGGGGAEEAARVMTMSEFRTAPEKFGQRLVRVPVRSDLPPDKSGAPHAATRQETYLAKSPGDYDKANEQIQTYSKANRMLGVLESFARTNPHGALFPTERAGEAKAAAANLKEAYLRMASDLNRQPNMQVVSILKNIVDDPAALKLGYEYRGMLKFMRDTLEENKDATINAHLYKRPMR